MDLALAVFILLDENLGERLRLCLCVCEELCFSVVILLPPSFYIPLYIDEYKGKHAFWMDSQHRTGRIVKCEAVLRSHPAKSTKCARGSQTQTHKSKKSRL